MTVVEKEKTDNSASNTTQEGVNLSTKWFNLGIRGKIALPIVTLLVVGSIVVAGNDKLLEKVDRLIEPEYWAQYDALFATHENTMTLFKHWNNVFNLSSGSREESVLYVRDNYEDVLNSYRSLRESIDKLPPSYHGYFFRNLAVLRVIEADFRSERKDSATLALLSLEQARVANDKARTIVDNSIGDDRAFFNKMNMRDLIKSAALNIDALTYYVTEKDEDRKRLDKSLGVLGGCDRVLNKGVKHQKLLKAMGCLDEFKEQLETAEEHMYKTGGKK